MIEPVEHSRAMARRPLAVIERRAFFRESFISVNLPSSLIGLSIDFAVLTGCQTGFLFEEPDEAGYVTVTDLCDNILQAHIGLRQQVNGFFQPLARNIFRNAHTGLGFEDFAHILRGNREVFCHIFDLEIIR